MTLIEKGNPYKECYMYIDGYVKSSTRECQQLGALGMRQQFNTQNRHGLNPECAILVLVTPRMSTRLV
jgi:hypothetical protein